MIEHRLLMVAKLSFSFDPADALLFVGFEPESVVATPDDVEQLCQAITQRCERAPARVHLFFDLTGLTVASGLVGEFSERKLQLCERLALSTWHYGGNLAERVMTRNALTRRGLKPNLFRNREEALEAFRAARRKLTEPRELRG